MTREELIAEIRKCAEELGHVPALNELVKTTQIRRHAICKHFVSYQRALQACGLERRGNYPVSLKSIFTDWAEAVRRLGKVPTIWEYQTHSKYSYRPLLRHYKAWPHVPAGMLEYAREVHMDEEWKDVLDIVEKHLERPGKRACKPRRTQEKRAMPGALPDEPLYGPPMCPAPLTYAPTNEAGVMFLFGAMAKDLGFAVTRIQTGFPDCEAMREVERERWQRVRIELEYESRNFVAHMHPVEGCDLIVCWNHNWPECPIEVLELRRAVSTQPSAFSENQRQPLTTVNTDERE